MTYLIAALTLFISILAFSRPELTGQLKFNAYAIHSHHQYYRFFSHTLVHGGVAHLVFNMLVLLSFGIAVEEYYRTIWGVNGLFYYFVLYWGGALLSSAPSYFKHRYNSGYNAVGASGAISAIVFASILFDPGNKIYIFLIPFGIPAFIFGAAYLIFSAWMARRNVGNIGHDAHFWGAIFGFIFTLLLKPDLIVRFFRLIKAM